MNKERHIRVRVTQTQMNRLVRKIKQDNITISVLIRDLIDCYLSGFCRTDNYYKIKKGN